MNTLVKSLLLSVFIFTFTSEAMAQRRSRSSSVSRSRSTRAVQRKPVTRSRRAINDRRSTRSRRRVRVGTVHNRRILDSRTRRSTYRHNRVNVGRFTHSGRRFRRTHNYYNWVLRRHPRYVRTNWVMYPTLRSNGFFYHNYPYFVFNGYQHRYSAFDYCNYELVDGFDDYVVESFGSRICSVGYDMCADARDDLNYYESSNRYYCAESYDRP